MPLYFAYGSNLGQSQMLKRCPGASILGVAELAGYRLGFTRYSSGWGGGVADVIPDDAQSVWGLVYTLTEADLSAVDEYEGYPQAYDRFQANVESHEGAISGVWVYTVVNKKGFIPPTSSYMGLIKSAAAGLSFPRAYRDFLDSFDTTPLEGMS